MLPLQSPFRGVWRGTLNLRAFIVFTAPGPAVRPAGGLPVAGGPASTASSSVNMLRAWFCANKTKCRKSTPRPAFAGPAPRPTQWPRRNPACPSNAGPPAARVPTPRTHLPCVPPVPGIVSGLPFPGRPSPCHSVGLSAPTLAGDSPECHLRWESSPPATRNRLPSRTGCGRIPQGSARRRPA